MGDRRGAGLMADAITRGDLEVLNQAYWWFAELAHKEPEGTVTPEMVDSLRGIYYYLENDLDVKQIEADDQCQQAQL